MKVPMAISTQAYSKLGFPIGKPTWNPQDTQWMQEMKYKESFYQLGWEAVETTLTQILKIPLKILHSLLYISPTRYISEDLKSLSGSVVLHAGACLEKWQTEISIDTCYLAWYVDESNYHSCKWCHERSEPLLATSTAHGHRKFKLLTT